MPRQLYYNELDNLSLTSPAEETKLMTTVNKKDKPKRNRSAFIIFSSEMRPLIKSEEKQKLNSNEMMVKLADLWKGLNEEERKKYYDMAEKEKVRYLLELNEFYQTHPFDVIQNKTKNNHVKKPCSAYGLFLKETKKVVKVEKPDLKMADVLKIVAERWKVLDDKTRKIYQEQAKAEKEVVKAKINENTSEDDKCYASSLPQKRLQSQKRVKKALLKENIKVTYTHPELKMEEVSTSEYSPFEEAVFATLSETNDSEVTPNHWNTFPTDEMILNHIPSFNMNYNRMPSIEPFSSNNQIAQNNVEMIMDTVDLKPKKSNDFLMDLLNFQSIQQDFGFKYSMKNSLVNQTSSCSAIRSNNCKPSRQVLNDALVSALDFGCNNEFDFDYFNFENNLSTINF
jgi:hypothetical protein